MTSPDLEKLAEITAERCSECAGLDGFDTITWDEKGAKMIILVALQSAVASERERTLDEIVKLCDEKAEKHRVIMKRHDVRSEVWKAQQATVATACEMAEAVRSLKSNKGERG